MAEYSAVSISGTVSTHLSAPAVMYVKFWYGPSVKLTINFCISGGGMDYFRAHADSPDL